MTLTDAIAQIGATLPRLQAIGERIEELDKRIDALNTPART